MVLRITCTKLTWGKEAGDALNQVPRGRGFWPVIVIPAPDGRSATLAVRSGDDTYSCSNGIDSKDTTHKGKSEGGKGGNGGNRSKGGKSKSNDKSTFKGQGDPLKQRFVSRTQCRLCGGESLGVTLFKPPVGFGVSQAWGVETWTVSPSTDTAETRLRSRTSQKIPESTNLMVVTMTMPEWYAILDCVAVTLPVQIGSTKTWIEAFVVPGCTPHLISRRWLSQHRCLANFDPNNLCLESPEIGSVPLVLHSSGHLLMSLVNLLSTLDQHTVIIDYLNSSSGFARSVQRRDERTAGATSMGSLQPKDQVVDKRATVETLWNGVFENNV